MRLRVIATNGCSGGTCPTAYVTDQGTVVVQGYVISDAETLGELNLPEGESAVEIPLALLVEAAQGVSLDT